MTHPLQIGISYDAFSVDFEIPLDKVENWFAGLQARNAASREIDECGGPEPLRHWVICPHCQADAAHLGSVQLDDRMVRICIRCRTLFEVEDGSV